MWNQIATQTPTKRTPTRATRTSTFASPIPSNIILPTEEESSLDESYEESKPAGQYSVDLDEESISNEEIDDLLEDELDEPNEPDEMSINHLTKSVSKMTMNSRMSSSEYSLEDKSPYRQYQYTEGNQRMLAVDFLIKAAPKKCFKLKLSNCGRFLHLRKRVPVVFL